MFRSAAIGLLALAACGGGGTNEPNAPVATVTLTPSPLALVFGETGQLTPTLKDAQGHTLSGRAVTWTTSASGVATVSTSGVVNGAGPGTATITATAEGKSGSAEVSVANPLSFVAVAAGGAHTCALTANGAAYCWGRDEAGQLGSAARTTCPLDAEGGGTQLYPCSVAPVLVQGGLAFSQLTAGGAHSCGLSADGSAYCWGENNAGQLGNGNTNDSSTPVPVSGGLHFSSIDGGALYTCGLTSGGAGAAYCWGSNGRGQLGNGTSTNSAVPVPVTGGLSFQAITAGAFSFGHTCGLTAGGAAYCWGDNSSGQLGLASVDLNAHATPAAVSGGLGFAALSAGLGSHTCGMTTAGAGYCWGLNTYGALGNNTTATSAVPVPVTGGIVFAQIVAGGFIGHSCGRTAGNVAYCWGENERGAIGDGTTADRPTPVAVAGGLGFTQLDAGYRHTCGLATNGVLYCWGSGGAGQLGTGSKNQSNAPAKVVGQP